AADIAEHAQVPLAVRYFVLDTADVLQEEYLSRLRACLGAPSQNANGIVVIPVVDDTREQIAARSGGKRIDETADLGAGPVAKARPRDGLFGAGHRSGQIDHRSAQLAMGAQDGDQQAAVAAAHVDDVAECAPRVGGGNHHTTIADTTPEVSG